MDGKFKYKVSPNVPEKQLGIAKLYQTPGLSNLVACIPVQPFLLLQRKVQKKNFKCCISAKVTVCWNDNHGCGKKYMCHAG